ncbi:MAG: preprotein translocase subunit SecA [Anaerolineae bacterium]
MGVKDFIRKLFGDRNQREIARLQQTVEVIKALEPDFHALSDAALRAKTEEFRRRLAQGETLEDLLPEAFAAVREAGRRTIGLRHYDVQLIGGMILHAGKVAEMRTGEGKTLVATLPLYLNALGGDNVHLVTPNDYLAKFGVQWMGPIYRALGVSVSVIQSAAGNPDEASFLYDPTYTSADDRFQYLKPITRREAYRTDITYGTNNEFGFDYLRDNMVTDLSQRSQGELHYAIIDEVDSILIDEARTPLIISGPAEEPSELYQRFARIVRGLQRDVDYEVDERSRIAMLTEEGVAHVEAILDIPEDESIYDSKHAHVLPYLDNALRAKEFFERDKEYVVRDGEIVIIDQFTGRMMFGRRYSEGLHQAIEAKERVEIRRESLTYATITFQNFFRMYEKLAGMTGTAATEEEELRKIYGLEVTVLPTNVEYRARFGDLEEKKVPLSKAGVAFAGILNAHVAGPYPQTRPEDVDVTVFDGDDGERYYRRLDMDDQIYKTIAAKFRAVLREIEAAYEAGRPVLVGTTAIETSEQLSRLLKRHRIPHNVLNAKYHEQEATIIAQAGRPGSVTIATNMAGRGVDILLGGNPEGLAREALRKKGLDLTDIPSDDWESALKMAQRGEDPTSVYGEPWAAVLWEKVQECQADRERVYRLGGLHVIGTERHEARRIDNQLRGRAGRQGDPGSSRFYISLEDELMRRFGGERLKPWMERAGLDEAPLEFNVLSRIIGSIQERVEGYNFDIRRHVLEYDNVVNKQREVVYAERLKILSRDDLHEDLMEMVASEIRRVIREHAASEDPETGDAKSLLAEMRRFIPMPRSFTAEKLAALTSEELEAQLLSWADENYREMSKQLGHQVYRNLRQEELSLAQMAESEDPFLQRVAVETQEAFGEQEWAEWKDLPLRRLPSSHEAQVEEQVVRLYRLFRDRRLMLRVLDNHWVRHLTDLDVLREGIGLRAVGQQDPLVAYQREAYEMYQNMLASVQQQIVRSLFLAPRQMTTRRRQRPKVQLTSWRPQLQAAGGSAAGAPQRPKRGQKTPGRNDPCWCGSGKKYKHCHLRSDQRASR